MNRMMPQYYGPAVPPPLPRKGILMLPPPPPPATERIQGHPLHPDAAPSSRSSAWIYKPGFGVGSAIPGFLPDSLMGGDRIRPDRGHARRGLHSLSHFDYEELGTRPASQSTASAITIADVSPRLALQRILVLYENGEHREAAAFLRRLAPSTFRQLLPQLPSDLFIESMPHSLPILEALYAKLYLAGDKIWQETRATSNLRPEAVVWQMVRFFASQEDGLIGQMRWEFCGPFISSCKRLLSVVLSAEPKARQILNARKKALQRAIEGLGQHGMVGTSDEKLMNLHDALKVEFQKVQKSYFESLEKLETLSLVGGKNGKSSQAVTGHGKAPIGQSHQRQLSLKADEIQERLIKNKTLLNVVEPTLENTSLEILLGILQQRIELDKECLFQFTQLRKEVRMVDGQTSVAPILMRYQRGCQQVLELMREVKDDVEDGHNSDLSPYHSDSDSAVMMSGNSPYISKEARYNFISRSVRMGSKHNLRASILASSLSEVNLELHSYKGSSSIGPPSFVLHSSSGVSSGSGSSDTASNEDKSEAPPASVLCSPCHHPQLPPACPQCHPACGKRRLECGGPRQDCRVQRPRYLKAKKELMKSNQNLRGGRTERCRKCEEAAEPEAEAEADGEPVYQGIAEVRRTEDEEEIKKLKDEISKLRWELKEARSEVELEREKRKEDGGKTNSHNLVRKYGELYAQTRIETLDSLDALQELDGLDDLKSKLLFSVIVLSFRSVTSTVDAKKEQIKRILQLPPHPHPQVIELETAVTTYLRKATDSFDLTKNVEEVCSQIWATLYDYPSLKTCDGLIRYIKECVRTAWGLVNQSPGYTIEYETRQFQPELHVRFHSSDLNSSNISTYLWPALLETARPQVCLQKGVVIT